MLKYIFLFISTYCFGAFVDGEGVATLVEGDAKIYINKSESKIEKGFVFKSGSNLKTGDKSKAELFLSNGIRLVMLPNSSVIVNTLKQEDGSFIKPNPENKSVKELSPSITDFEVESGKVIGDVKKLAPMSVFTMKTPVGIVKIKGTVFSVEYKLNKDGTSSFNVGCLVGRIVVEMADPRVSPISVPAGKQMSASAQQGGPIAQSGDSHNVDNASAPPPHPPMQIELKELPPIEMKEMAMRVDMPPPPPPQLAPKQPQDKESVLDKIIQNIENNIIKEQLDPSPIGG